MTAAEFNCDSTEKRWRSILANQSINQSINRAFIIYSINQSIDRRHPPLSTMVVYDLDEPYLHIGGGTRYHKLRNSQSMSDFLGAEATHPRPRSPELKEKSSGSGAPALCSGRMCLLLTLLTLAAGVYLLVNSKSFQLMMYPPKVRQPPKLILIWDRNSRFLDVKPYREKKAIPRKGLQNAYAGCTCEVTSDAGKKCNLRKLNKNYWAIKRSIKTNPLKFGTIQFHQSIKQTIKRLRSVLLGLRIFPMQKNPKKIHTIQD